MHHRSSHGIGATVGVLLLACALSSACSSDREGGQVTGLGDSCNASTPCGAGFVCGTKGVCVLDGAPFGSGGTGGSAGEVGPAGANGVAAAFGDVCLDQHVRASRVTPTVILIIDQSGSMGNDFGGQGTRWNVLRDFLLDEQEGLIASLQSQVRFGLAMYSAVDSGDGSPYGECPQLTMVEPDINNYQPIYDAYSVAEPFHETPTGDAIDRVVSDLGLAAVGPDEDRDPVVFVLATDGEPDRCEELNPQGGQQESIDAVARAYDIGIRTFIISVGREVSEQHQQDVANAGMGRQPGDPDAEYWTAGDDQTLRDALTEIVGGQLSCEVKLQGRVDLADACLGTVLLNGEELTCNASDGWKLVDPQHIRLMGEPCDDLKRFPDAILSVTFPCDVEIIE